jgi:hypothetical protein
MPATVQRVVDGFLNYLREPLGLLLDELDGPLLTDLIENELR